MYQNTLSILKHLDSNIDMYVAPSFRLGMNTQNAKSIQEPQT